MAGESRWVRDEMKMKRLAHSTAIYWKAAASQLARQRETGINQVGTRNRRAFPAPAMRLNLPRHYSRLLASLN